MTNQVRNSNHPTRRHSSFARALAKMSRSAAGRLRVVNRGELEGVLTLQDLVKFLSLKMELAPGKK